jgi:membrane fusion protein (multidrug efflux system)
MKAIKISLLSLLILVISACTDSKESITAEAVEIVNRISVKTVEIKPGEIQVSKSYFGKLRFGQSMTYVAEMSGRVTAPILSPGTSVVKGQTLISFPPENHDLQIAQLQLLYDELKTNYARQKILYSKGALAKISVEEMETQLGIQAKALDQVKQMNVITAPFSGAITEVFVREGEEINPGSIVFSMAKLDEVQLEFFVPAKDVASIKLGSKTSIQQGGETIRGEVIQKAIQMDEERRAFRILASLQELGSLMVAGQTIEVNVLQSKRNGIIVVPQESVKQNGKKGLVYLAQNETAKVKEVILGERVGLGIIVENGLQKGDKLIVAGIEKIASGTAIKIISEKKSK